MRQHSFAPSAAPLPPSAVLLGLKGFPQLLYLGGETVPLHFRGVGLNLGTLTAVFLKLGSLFGFGGFSGGLSGLSPGILETVE